MSTRARVVGSFILACLICGGGLWWGLRGVTRADVPVDATGQKKVSIVLTPEGFVPRYVTITAGTTVVFSNTTAREYWPASDLHPSHSIYRAFDPMRPLEPEEVWEFTFDKVGSWGLHDHIRSYYTGVIHVVE